MSRLKIKKMKKAILLSIAIIATTAFAGNNKKHIDTYKVNTDISKVEWKASKVTGSHNGTVAIESGSMQNNHGKWTGNFVIDMTTIVCTDLEGGAKRDLEMHLASDDFFSVEKNPTATLKIKSTTPSADGNNNYTVVGDLTIKGITNEISLPAKIEIKENKLDKVRLDCFLMKNL